MAASGIRCVRRMVVHTPAREPDIRICVHEELHVEHFPYYLRVKDQNSFKEDNVCWVNRDPLFHPGNIQFSHRFSCGKKRSSWKRGEIPPTWNEWQSRMLALRLLFPRQCPLRFCTLTHCQKPLKFSKWEEWKFISCFCPHLGKLHKIIYYYI